MKASFEQRGSAAAMMVGGQAGSSARIRTMIDARALFSLCKLSPEIIREHETRLDERSLEAARAGCADRMSRMHSIAEKRHNPKQLGCQDVILDDQSNKLSCIVAHQMR
jgi:hypothetical protein